MAGCLVSQGDFSRDRDVRGSLLAAKPSDDSRYLNVSLAHHITSRSGWGSNSAAM
jgi:hypothetical protein